MQMEGGYAMLAMTRTKLIAPATRSASVRW
jgi:hypothetical protein